MNGSIMPFDSGNKYNRDWLMPVFGTLARQFSSILIELKGYPTSQSQ